MPHLVVYSQASLPTLFTLIPILRTIFIRERINIVHGHQAFSAMALEGILLGRSMGLHCCFTDHSLVGFSDASSMLMNKLLKFVLADIDHVICVSHTSRENTVLRAGLDPHDVSVIPNAVVSAQFKPSPSSVDNRFINIVVMSRLVYRKGIDLLVSVIPRVCNKHPRVRFIIAGDGNKRIDLEQMREQHMLQERVQLIGAVNHAHVRDVLTRGQIFLNTSLTEAFCIAILEAASCGLLVVSTKVGGVPEVLPEDLIIFAEPDTDKLFDSVEIAINKLIAKDIEDPWKVHNRVKEMYNWSNVAERTEKVPEL